MDMLQSSPDSSKESIQDMHKVFMPYNQVMLIVLNALVYENGLSLKELAQKTGLSVPAIQRLGKLYSSPDFTTLDACSNAIGSSLFYICAISDLLFHDHDFHKKINDYLFQDGISIRKASLRLLAKISLTKDKILNGEWESELQKLGVDPRKSIHN